jgi:hypothetical protein
MVSDPQEQFLISGVPGVLSQSGTIFSPGNAILHDRVQAPPTVLPGREPEQTAGLLPSALKKGGVPVSWCAWLW